MGWKKALFFGGAVLVLAACSDSATAPTALRQADAPSAAWTWTTTSSTTTSTTTTSDTTTVTDPLCTGVVIRTGVTSDVSTSSCASSW